jgi:hypothetical protein
MTEKRKEELFIKTLLANLNKLATDTQIKQAIKDLEEIGKLLDDPGYIKNKSMALTVCNMLIGFSLESGMAKGSIGHKLSLRLYDYINRME